MCTPVVVAKANEADQVEVVDLAHHQEPGNASRGEVADQEPRTDGGLHGGQARAPERHEERLPASSVSGATPQRVTSVGARGGMRPCGQDTRADVLGIFA